MINSACGTEIVNLTGFHRKGGHNQGQGCLGLAGTTQAKDWSQECAEQNRDRGQWQVNTSNQNTKFLFETRTRRSN